MIVKKSLPENDCWIFNSRYSDITDQGAFICDCWNFDKTTQNMCCFSQCFEKSSFSSILFLIGVTCAIFGVDDKFFKE